METKTIALVGPESTGKSTLCEKLSAHFEVPWVPEFARSYLEAGNLVKSPQDLVYIAKEQIKSQNINRSILFIDNDLYNIVVWSEVVFGECDSWLLEQEEREHHDLYLLTKPDIPWVPDGLRVSPFLREKLWNRYRNRLIEKKRNFVEIEGENENRFQNSLLAIQNHL